MNIFAIQIIYLLTLIDIQVSFTTFSHYQLGVKRIIYIYIVLIIRHPRLLALHKKQPTLENKNINMTTKQYELNMKKLFSIFIKLIEGLKCCFSVESITGNLSIYIDIII